MIQRLRIWENVPFFFALGGCRAGMPIGRVVLWPLRPTGRSRTPHPVAA